MTSSSAFFAYPSFAWSGLGCCSCSLAPLYLALGVCVVVSSCMLGLYGRCFIYKAGRKPFSCEFLRRRGQAAVDVAKVALAGETRDDLSFPKKKVVPTKPYGDGVGMDGDGTSRRGCAGGGGRHRARGSGGRAKP
jgi:hypothetical protein